MDDDVASILNALKTDVEAMLDKRYIDDNDEFYLSGFGTSFLDEDGEPVISWPNLRYHMGKVEELLEKRMGVE